MHNNPYQIFGVDENITSYELRQILLDYKIKAMAFNMLYAAYFTQVGPIAMRLENSSQLIEKILSKRYEYGMEFDQIPLGENEIGDFLRRVTLYRKQASGEGVSTITAEDVDKRVEMYTMSAWYTKDLETKIEKAIEEFDNNPTDDSKLMDTLLSIRYGELKTYIAREIAKRVSSNGIMLDEKGFSDIMLSSAPYEQLKKIYEQIATKDKRDELVPEMYIAKNMSDMSGVTVIGNDTIRHLLEKEHKYTNEYFKDMMERFDGTKDRAEPALHNQNHDYAWGMVLEEPSVIMDNELVNTPIFQGRIKVERLGAFTEKSLFARSKYAREIEIRTRRRARVAERKGFLSRLTMKRGDDKDSNTPQTMREQFYLHEAKKTMVDNVWRVTKTNKDGIAATYIIFTPLEYLGNRGSELFEFIKNIYLSDYMLDIAMQNGGYAGRVQKDDDGFSISTKYNQEEIASAVLFKYGQRGSIRDCRERGRKVVHSDKTIDDFMDLINSRSRGERVKDE